MMTDYDDYDDEHCYYCGKDLDDLPIDYKDWTLWLQDAVDNGFCSIACFIKGQNGEQSDTWGKPQLTDSDRAKVRELQTKLYNHKTEPTVVKLEDLNLPDGDFSWISDEAGDWNVYHCGEKDCPVGWHTMAYAENIERKDGRLTIEFMSVDSGGNWDTEYYYDSDETDSINELPFNHLDNYFKGWAEYWLDAAETGKDPCNQASLNANEDWISYCLKAAEDNIKYLFM